MTEAKPSNLDSKQLSGIVSEHQKKIVVVKEELEGIRVKKEAIRKESLVLSGNQLISKLKDLQVQIDLEAQKLSQLIFLLESSGEIQDKVDATRKEEADAVMERLRLEEEERIERAIQERRNALLQKWGAMTDEEREEWFLKNGN